MYLKEVLCPTVDRSGVRSDLVAFLLRCEVQKTSNSAGLALPPGKFRLDLGVRATQAPYVGSRLGQVASFKVRALQVLHQAEISRAGLL